MTDYGSSKPSIDSISDRGGPFARGHGAMNVRNGSIDAVDNSRRIRSFFYSYLFTSRNSIIDLNAKNPDVRFCLKAQANGLVQ